MKQQTRKRLAWGVLFLLLLWLLLWVKMMLLPLFAHPLTSITRTSSNTTFITIFSFGLLLLGLVLVALLHERKKTTIAHGSAHFATSEELSTYGTLIANPRKEQRLLNQALTTGATPLPSKMYVGLVQKKLMVLDERTQESHVFLLAPSGVGKTSRIVIPALLREFGSRSLFINDTKGELVEVTLGHLAQYHRCLIFAPTTPRNSHHYNPLAHVHTMDDAEALATCLIENTGTSREEFWNSAPKLLVAAAVLHLRAAEPNAPFSRLIDLLCGSKLDAMHTLFRQSPSPVAHDVGTAFFENLQKNERLAGSIMVEMATRFFRFKNPSLREVTASDDFDFTRMVDEPTAVFLSIPEDEAHRLKPLSACFILQMMSILVRRASRSPERRLPRAFAFYLDEFCNAGVIPHFTNYISTVRSRGIAFILAVQDFGQLRATYDDNGRDTILANCSTHIVFPGCSLQETHYYSEKLGRTTVETISSSEQAGSTWLTTPQTWTHGETHRDLMTPDELRTMPDGTLLVLSGKLHPIVVHNTPYYQDAVLLREAKKPFAPASRVTVTPVAPTPLSPSMGLPAPTPTTTTQGTAAGPAPKQPSPGPQPKTPPPTSQDDAQFFSPE